MTDSKSYSSTPKTPVPPAQAIDTGASTPAIKPDSTRHTETAGTVPQKKGFDPYNSGAFDRRGAWDKVTRK